MDQSNSNKKRPISRRQLLATLGAAGIALGAKTLLPEKSLGATVTGSTYGNLLSDDPKNLNRAGGGAPFCIIHGSVEEMKADSKLKSGMLTATAGYFEPGDGGASYYLIQDSQLPEDGGSVINLNSGLQAILVPVDSVNYKQFGAVGDGVNDDGVQIKNAHNFANEHDLPVVNESGEYWIKQTNLINIQTNVRWGHTRIYIDERYNERPNPRFQITSKRANIPIVLDASTKASLVSKLRPGTTMLPELADYKGSLIMIWDENDIIAARYGYNSGRRKEDLFYIEEHGRVIGDISWTFNGYTSLIAVPCDENYLIVEGGTFLLTGENGGDSYEGYFHNGILINRSRTIIRNQWVGLAPGKADTSYNPRQGFYFFRDVYDVLLENVRLIPFEKDRQPPGYVLPAGTYGIGGARVMNATFRNVSAEGSKVHWGVFGTNIFKNFRVESCYLNRVDVHFHCWNLYVKDSEIGYRGFTVTGGGDLFIENTKRYGNTFVSFRRDYGSRWDGNIRLKNCRLVIDNGAGNAYALDYNPANFDYKYEIGYGRTIKVDDFIFDYTGLPDTSGTCEMMRIASFSKISDTGDRIHFPKTIEFSNVSAVGRDKGVRLLRIANPYSFKLEEAGGMDGQRVISNCYMRFENIHSEVVPEQTSQASTHVNFLLNALGSTPYDDEHALYPKIDFINVGEFFGHFKGAVADVYFNRSTINCVDAYEGGPLRGRIVFDNCDIRARAEFSDRNFYHLGTMLGVYFINCTAHAPIVGGVSRPDLLHWYEFIEVNRKVAYNHLNTKLSKELMDYFANNGNPLRPEFIEMLKSHHQEESVYMARRYGKTSERPDPSAFRSEPGFAYFDTDLGKLVVWNGSQWVSPV